MSKTEVHITHLLDITQGWTQSCQNTFQNITFSNSACIPSFFHVLEPVIKLIGEGEYNLNVLKEINVTESYLGLDQVIRYCDEKESLQDCKTKL